MVNILEFIRVCSAFVSLRWSICLRCSNFSLINLHFLPSSANPLPAGIITADGQQQNVMVYTTSYQQVESLLRQRQLTLLMDDWERFTHLQLNCVAVFQIPTVQQIQFSWQGHTPSTNTGAQHWASIRLMTWALPQSKGYQTGRKEEEASTQTLMYRENITCRVQSVVFSCEVPNVLERLQSSWPIWGFI